MLSGIIRPERHVFDKHREQDSTESSTRTDVYMAFRWYDAPALILHKTHCLIVLACNPPLRIASQPPTVLLRVCNTCCITKGGFTQHPSIMECHRSSIRHETIQEAYQHHVLPIHVTASPEYNSNAILHFPSHYGCLLFNTPFTSPVIHCKQAPAGLPVSGLLIPLDPCFQGYISLLHITSKAGHHQPTLSLYIS